MDSELLLSYDAYLRHDIMVMTVRLAILLSVLLTVPLIQFPVNLLMSFIFINTLKVPVKGLSQFLQCLKGFLTSLKHEMRIYTGLVPYVKPHLVVVFNLTTKSKV